MIFGNIIHDWGWDQKRILVQKAYDSLNEGGSVIAYESFHTNDRKDYF